MVNAHMIYNEVTAKRVKMPIFWQNVCQRIIFGEESLNSDNTNKRYLHLILAGETRKNFTRCYRTLIKDMPRSEASKKFRRLKTCCAGCPSVNNVTLQRIRNNFIRLSV